MPFLNYKPLRLGVVKGVFGTSYCCYGNLLCNEN